MDIEIMTIEVNKEDYLAKDYLHARFYRTMLRKEDEEGKFRVLNRELEQMANEYSKDFDDVL